MPPIPILKNYAPQIDQFTKNSGGSVENIRKTSTKFDLPILYQLSFKTSSQQDCCYPSPSH